MTLYKCCFLFVLLFQGFAFMGVVFLVYNENWLEIKQPILVFSFFLQPLPHPHLWCIKTPLEPACRHSSGHWKETKLIMTLDGPSFSRHQPTSLCPVHARSATFKFIPSSFIVIKNFWLKNPELRGGGLAWLKLITPPAECWWKSGHGVIFFIYSSYFLFRDLKG